MQENKKTYQWVSFIGLIMLLLGIYGSARTIINSVAFDKYPMDGVYPALPFFQNPYIAPVSGREEDCMINYQPYAISNAYAIPYPSTSPDGSQVKPMSDDQIKAFDAQQKLQQANCISQVKEARDKAKINDISQSMLFLLMGAGVLAYKKIFKLG